MLDSELLSLDPNLWVSFARPSSNHSGGVNAIFCDTHAKFIREDIDPWVYNQLMSVSNTQARSPRYGHELEAEASPHAGRFQLTDGRTRLCRKS